MSILNLPRPMRLIALVIAGFSITATSANACLFDAPAPDFDAMLAAEKVFDETGSNLQRINAYGTLLRTKDSNLRRSVIRMGLEKLDDVDIRGSALHCKFVTSSALTIDTMPLAAANAAMADMTDPARAIILEGKTYNFPFFYTDVADGCASLYFQTDDECPANSSAAVTGVSVVFRNGRNIFGRFELNDENTLVGEIGIWNGGGHDVVPATAKLD